MALGALVVLVVLVAAGLYIPRRSKTTANEHVNPPTQEQTPAAGASSNMTPTPVTTSGNSAGTTAGTNAGATQPPNVETQPVSPPETPQIEKKAGVTKKAAAVPGAQPQQTQAETQTAAPPPPSNDAAQIEELEQTVDQLSGRAAAVDSSLDNLKRQQASQGFGLRGDIASTQEMMKTHLARAQAALQSQDVKNAKKYSDLASSDIEKLETFLGR